MAAGRFAPSPTGPLHVGNLRTALLAWLFARSSGVGFVMRVEDLDPATASAEHEAGQLADLAAIGVDHDPPVLRQSERRDAHQAALAVLAVLVDVGRTFPCWCSRREVQAAVAAPHGPDGARYPGTCRDLDGAGRRARAEEAGGRPPALRLRAEGEEVTVVDRYHGSLTGVVDDIVLRRGDGLVAYNLAVVVDDAAQDVTEVVRGDDLLASTPAQALLGRLLGLAPPTWTHVPLVLGPDGARLAKRHTVVVDGRPAPVATTLADLAAAGWRVPEVVGALAATAGLVAPGTACRAVDLLDGFDPAALTRTPTTWAVPMGRGPAAGTDP